MDTGSIFRNAQTCFHLPKVHTQGIQVSFILFLMIVHHCFELPHGKLVGYFCPGVPGIDPAIIIHKKLPVIIQQPEKLNLIVHRSNKLVIICLVFLHPFQGFNQ